MRGWIVVLATELLACQSATPAPEHGHAQSTTTRSSTAARVRGVRYPQVVSTPPNRPFVDLGPVFLSDELRNAASPLVLEADRLDADGFIIESESLRSAYVDRHPTIGGWSLPVNRGPTGDVGSTLINTAYALVVAVFAEQPDYSTPPKGTYLRAYRLIEDEPTKRDLSAINLDLSARARAFLGEATNLRGQLERSHALVSTGEVDLRTYERLRTFLAKSG